jgi:hypothetical protein
MQFVYWTDSSFKVAPFVQLDEGESADLMVIFKYILLKTVWH